MPHDPRHMSHSRGGATLTGAVRAVAAVAAMLALVLLAGIWLGSAEAHPGQAPLPQPGAVGVTGTLRVYGYPVVSNPNYGPEANRPATAGSAGVVDPLTGLLAGGPAVHGRERPVRPAVGRGAADGLRDVGSGVDLGAAGRSGAAGDVAGPDGHRRGQRGRAHPGRQPGRSEKVWLRHWYEPQHLDKDLNADERLTDADDDGVPDAPLSRRRAEHRRVVPGDHDRADLHARRQRPAAAAGAAAERAAPVGAAAGVRRGRARRRWCSRSASRRTETDPAGPAEGYGLTSLDVDFDGRIDMVNVTDEESLPDRARRRRSTSTATACWTSLNPDGAAADVRRDGGAAHRRVQHRAGRAGAVPGPLRAAGAR